MNKLQSKYHHIKNYPARLILYTFNFFIMYKHEVYSFPIWPDNISNLSNTYVKNNTKILITYNHFYSNYLVNPVKVKA